MKKISMIFVALLATAPAFSATPEELDKLLQGIDLDIEALRLSSPPGNNALEKINEFRGEAPFDFRVVRLAYSWGEAYISLSKEARANGNYTKAQGYLDKVWKVAALTKGLEDEQRAVDEALSNSGQAKPTVVAAVTPNAAEIERQRKLADAAAKEKQRLKVEAEKQQKELALRQVEADRKAAAERERREKMERERRAALAAAQKAEQEAAEAARAAAKPVKRASPLMSSPVDLDDIALDDIIPPVAKPRAVKKPTPKPVVRTPKPSAKTLKTPVAQSTRLWAGASVNTKAIKTYEVPADSLANRDRKVADKMGDICQVMVDKDASVVVTTVSKSDYRWLAVRLTLCARRLDSGYRLRHSYQPLAKGGTPTVALHPPRESSLLERSAN
jgi:colicin import membrane protein